MSRWTVLSVDDTGHLRLFLHDDLFTNLVLAAVEGSVKHLSGVDEGGDVWLGGGGVLPVVPENISGVFLDDSAAPEGLCKSSRQLWVRFCGANRAAAASLTVGVAGLVVRCQEVSVGTRALNVASSYVAKVFATTVVVLAELRNYCRHTEDDHGG